MKSALSGLFGLPEQRQNNSFVQDSVLASNHQLDVDGLADTITGLGQPVSTTTAGVNIGLASDHADAESAATSTLEALIERFADGDLPRFKAVTSGLAQAAGTVHEHEHEHEHSGGICAGLLSEDAWLASQGAAGTTQSSSGPVSLSAPLAALNQTFLLHSNPGASKTIYLDFDGHTTTGTGWNNSTMGSSFYSPAYDTNGNASSFSDNELTTIQSIWQRVAADFSCFDVNVTTQAPPTDWLINSGNGDSNYGIRVVITSYGPSSSTNGGIAYIDSFDWNSDTPCFVYNTSLLGVSEAISHEVGHTMGLSHDGTASTSYYKGHGSGETGWAPIMGTAYYQSVTTWDNGTFTGSTNTGTGANYSKGADDLAIITSNNGFSYQSDLEGNTLSSASALTISEGIVSQFGTIETSSDIDWFRFDLIETGTLTLNFNPYAYVSYIDNDGIWGGELTPWYSTVNDPNTSTTWVDNGSNLDLSVELLNASGVVLASSNPTGLTASLSASSLAAGTYYLRLDGVGFGDPTALTPTGYSDYASIGDYLITGSISGSGNLPVISLAASTSSVSEDGTENLLFTFSRTGDFSAELDVLFSVGGSATAGADYSGLTSSGSTQTIRFAAGASSVSLMLDPSTDTNVEANETVSLILLSGTGYSLGLNSTASITIINDDLAPQTVFSASTDVLTGAAKSADAFELASFQDALISGSSSLIFDRITNLEAGSDWIDTPSTRTSAIGVKQLGSVSALTASAIGTVLNAKGAFSRNGASTFTYSDPFSGTRTFLALNNSTSSFSSTGDAIIEITGYSGNLASLQVF